MIIVGIDPSLTGTGIAIVDTDDRLVIEVKTHNTKGTRADTIPQRLDRLRRLVADIVTDAFHADLVVIEVPAMSKANSGTSMLNGFWWMLVSALDAAGRRIATAQPTSLKKYATGKGNASKDTVILAVARRFPHAYFTNNNEADALVLAAMGADACGYPLVDMPASHRAALDGVQWSAGRGAA